MSYFDDASLVMIPSGYKTSKVYSVKPTDGSGDLTFSRSNDTATRVNSAGLIEKVRTNLVLQSQTLDNATWSKLGSTITANATAAPDGTTTADSNIESAALDEHGVSQVLSISAGLNTISVSVKANGRTRCRIGFANSNYGGMTSDQRFAYFDVSTGTIVQNISGGSSTIVSEGNGWYRCSVSQNLVAGDASGAVQLLFIDSGVTTFYTGDGTSGLFLWGAQLETGDIATSYIATTSAAISVGPVANVPRLDYLNSSCPKLNLEPQRTNAQTFSEDLTQSSAWGLGAITISANATTSPDGYQNADKLVETATTARHELYGKTLTFSGTSSVSFYAKAGERRYLSCFVGGDQTVGGVTFDLQTGTAPLTSGGTTAKIEAVSGAAGWYRCSYTSTKVGSTTTYFCLRQTLGASPNVETYAGDGVSGLYLWGIQTEIAGAYATSYIPTLGAAVTRGEDACSKTGISSLIGQTEGTLFADFVWTKVGKTYQSIILGGTTNYNNTVYLLTTESSGAASYQLRIGGTTAIATLNTTFTNGTRYKIALAYKSGSIAFYVNGASVGTSSATYGAVSEAISQFRYDWPYGGDEQWCSPVNQTLLFKTRLSNSSLAELTSL